MVIVIELGWCGVARNIDIRPAVVVVIERGNAKAMVAGCVLNAAGLADVLKLAVPQIVVEGVGCARQAAGSAEGRHPFPNAVACLAGSGRVCQVEVDIVRNHQVQLAIAIIVNKRAAGAPLLSGSGHSGYFREFPKSSVSLVVVEPILAIAGHIEIVISIIVIVADADALPPCCTQQAGVCRYIGKRAIVIVVKEMARRFGRDPL